MAGLDKNGVFGEKISPFLEQKMVEIEKTLGNKSPEYRALYAQYVQQPQENIILNESNNRHWEAELHVEGQLRGLERLYAKTAVIESTMVCASHCRYCLRANYNIFTLSEIELLNIAKYCGSDSVRRELNEVLITGGDPLVLPNRLNFLVESLVNYAPNIKTIRIATRLPLHYPSRIDDNVYNIFRNHSDKVNFELATQINHPVDLFPESIEAYKKIRDLGVAIYSQNVLLKGVNDNIETLAALYNKMREVGIESHYLFHCVPMKGMGHFRTSVLKGLELAKDLTNSGIISGRAKPMYALMTDIGKIILYEHTYLGKKENNVYIQSSYKYTDRLHNNPNWVLPETAEVDEQGYLRMWYLDGTDD